MTSISRQPPEHAATLRAPIDSERIGRAAEGVAAVGENGGRASVLAAGGSAGSARRVRRCLAGDPALENPVTW